MTFAFYKWRIPYNCFIVVALLDFSTILYLGLLPILGNLWNEEDRNGSRVKKDVEGNKAELWSFEKSLVCFQGIAFLLLLSSSPFLSIFYYPLLFSNLLIALCYEVRQVRLYPLPIYYLYYVYWLERVATLILLFYKQFGITSYKFLPFGLFVLSNLLHIIMNYKPYILLQEVLEKISSHIISGTLSILQPKESGKEHSETDAKNQADDGVIINNVHESDQSDYGFIVNNFHGSDDSEAGNENGNATVDDEIGGHLKREMEYQLVPSLEEEDDDDDDVSEVEDDDDVSSREDLKTDLMAELESSNVAPSAAAKEESKSDEQEEERRVVLHNHEEDDAKYKREMTKAAIALVEFRLEKSQESADQYYKKYIEQLLKYLSKCEEDKKSLNEKLNVSKAACEEQSQKWEEERKDLVSKLNNAASLLEHHRDTVDAFNEDRCKWEEEKAKLKSDMEELTYQNGENALSLINRFEGSMADKELLSAQLREAKESKKYYKGRMHESENMRLKLLEDNEELAAKLQDATVEADHYYTLLHGSDERCRSWQEAYYSIYYNYYINPDTNAV